MLTRRLRFIAKPRMSPQHVMLGSWSEGMDARPTVLDERAALIGRSFAIASIFRGSGDTWPYATDEVLGQGRTLLVAWYLQEYGTYAQWAAGAFDSVLTAQATALKAYGGAVALRPWAEMNADWVDYQPTAPGSPAKAAGGTYAEFVAAWRHCVDVFRTAGATNVSWVFCPTTDTYIETADIRLYYPGDDYVDYIGLDGYNWGDSPPLLWMSFDYVYQVQYARVLEISSRPVWICETGSSDPQSTAAVEANVGAPVGFTKGMWWQDMITMIMSDSYSRVQAIVFFDSLKERDWRLDSSPESLDGLKTALSYLSA